MKNNILVTSDLFEKIEKYITDIYVGENIPDEIRFFPEIACDIYNTFENEVYSTYNEKKLAGFNPANAFIHWCSGLPSIICTDYYYNVSAISELKKIIPDHKYDSEDLAAHLLTTLIYKAVVIGNEIYYLINSIKEVSK